jgi:hypothetical protein
MLLGCGRQSFTDRVEAADDCGDSKHYVQDSCWDQNNACPPASSVDFGVSRAIAFINAIGKDDTLDIA